MKAGGVALVVLGSWVIVQVLFGHALDRLGVV
jgi:hypothetical protein